MSTYPDHAKCLRQPRLRTQNALTLRYNFANPARNKCLGPTTQFARKAVVSKLFHAYDAHMLEPRLCPCRHLDPCLTECVAVANEESQGESRRAVVALADYDLHTSACVPVRRLAASHPSLVTVHEHHPVTDCFCRLHSGLQSLFKPLSGRFSDASHFTACSERLLASITLVMVLHTRGARGFSSNMVFNHVNIIPSSATPLCIRVSKTH